MRTVLITGGTGLIGKALMQSLLDRGYAVIILSREINDKPAVKNLSYALWNLKEKTIDRDAIAKADHIIHLAGAGVADKRWAKKRKQEIVDSRVNSGHLIVDSLSRIPNQVRTVVSSSAIGWYGPDPVVQGDEKELRKFTEIDPLSNDFLGQTCKKWEESIEPVTAIGKRLVKLRTGIVLSKQGGALKEFTKPMKFGIAAILGNGRQIISWIDIEDLVDMYVAAIENEAMEGSYNAVAPNPVSNKELTLTLARGRKKFFIPVHVPAFLLRLVLGQMSIEVLKSATVSADKILKTGFHFKFPFIKSALER